MRSTPPILVDVDEVLLDWAAGFRAWMAEVGHNPAGEFRTWHLLDNFPSLHGRQASLDGLMLDFAERPDFGRLSVVEGAAEGLDHLRHIFPESLVIAVTSCGAGRRTEELRRANLAEHGLPVDHVITLPLHGSKRRVYAAFRPGIVIDDSLHNLVSAKACGHLPVAFDRPWNTDWSDARLHGWKSVPSLFANRMDI